MTSYLSSRVSPSPPTTSLSERPECLVVPTSGPPYCTQPYKESTDCDLGPNELSKFWTTKSVGLHTHPRQTPLRWSKGPFCCPVPSPSPDVILQSLMYVTSLGPGLGLLVPKVERHDVGRRTGRESRQGRTQGERSVHPTSATYGLRYV